MPPAPDPPSAGPRSAPRWTKPGTTSTGSSATTPAGLRRPSGGTKWTSQQLLFHMLFGYLIVRALLVLARGFGHLPDGASKTFARLLDAAHKSFHVINYLGACAGARIIPPRRMPAMLDRVIAAPHRHLDREPDSALRHALPHDMGPVLRLPHDPDRHLPLPNPALPLPPAPAHTQPAARVTHQAQANVRTDARPGELGCWPYFRPCCFQAAQPATAKPQTTPYGRWRFAATPEGRPQHAVRSLARAQCPGPLSTGPYGTQPSSAQNHQPRATDSRPHHHDVPRREPTLVASVSSRTTAGSSSGRASTASLLRSPRCRDWAVIDGHGSFPARPAATMPPLYCPRGYGKVSSPRCPAPGGRCRRRPACARS
jgi:hypothetical protein